VPALARAETVGENAGQVFRMNSNARIPYLYADPILPLLLN